MSRIPSSSGSFEMDGVLRLTVSLTSIVFTFKGTCLKIGSTITPRDALRPAPRLHRLALAYPRTGKASNGKLLLTVMVCSCWQTEESALSH